jgi:uncharacterized membrane protein
MDIQDNDSKKKLPLFTPIKNGSGWDLNMENKLAYVIWVIILAIPLAVGVFCLLMIKK